MFLDISNLVQMQGEMITRIEDHVNSKFYEISRDDIENNVIVGAVIDVERGREDLGKAEKFKKAATKKKFILLAILVVVVLIILLVILSEFGAFSSSGSSETIIKVYNKLILRNIKPLFHFSTSIFTILPMGVKLYEIKKIQHW